MESKTFSPEVAPEFSSKIDLHFFRHDEKEGDPLKNDYDIELSPKGREGAKAQAQETNLEQAMAFGSPRKRTQETAGFIMAGADAGITGNESLDELRAKIDGDIEYGSKIAVDPKLNFDMEGDTEYVKEAMTAYKAGTLIPFLIEKSDELALETGDTVSSTYSRMAASIAGIIKKYIGVAPRWNDLVKDEQKGYEPILERFLGTHQSMQESFLAKLLEVTKGTEERDRFAQVIGGKGFGYSEGFEVEIVTKEGDPTPSVRITYKKEGKTPETSFDFDETVSLETIEEISELK
ncbi:MAG: hypothetical protein RIT04_419 [Candidatus Parcubacteria bacterium]|jgi:hypothetical protein